MWEQDACGMDQTRMVASADPVNPRSWKVTFKQFTYENKVIFLIH